MRWGALGAALCAAVALTACGGKPDGCLPVDPAIAQAVADSARDGQAIQADSGVYYVALRIDAAGQDEVGVWALDSLSPSASVRSVDGYAQQFTSWPVLDGANGSDTARDVVKCLD